MKRMVLVTMVAVGLGGCGSGTTEAPVASTPAPMASMPEPGLLGEGVVMEVAIREPLSARESRPGDVFSADLVAPIVGNAGEILMPGEATVYGRVTAVTPTAIAVDVDRIEYGEITQPLTADVVAVDVASALDSDEMAMISGAVVLSPTEAATLPGLDLAASGGTAIAPAWGNSEVLLPPGTRLAVQFSDVVPMQ